jgi:pimeloyl-ACP methyl ester carboxylesterase
MKLLKRISIVVGTIALVIAGGLYFAYANLNDLDDEARRKAPGNFVKLSDGMVHYQWHGPADGDVTVLIHGFSTPSFVWRGVLPSLTAAGLRVLTYDHFGRGWSDRPDIDNTAALFDRQLTELLASQGIRQPFNLAGYSMGGAIAANHVARHPGKVKRLTLISPAGFPNNDGMMKRLLSLLDISAIGNRILSRPQDQNSAIPDIVDRYIEQISYKGYLRSLISTYRHYPMNEMRPIYDLVGKQNLPVAAIWGDADKVVPYDGAAHLKKSIPRVLLTTIAGGGHSITYTEHEKVATVLVGFFKQPIVR